MRSFRSISEVFGLHSAQILSNDVVDRHALQDVERTVNWHRLLVYL